MRLSVNFIANGTFYRAGEDINVNLIPPFIRKYELRPEDEAPLRTAAPVPTGQYVPGVSYQTDKDGCPMRDARTAAQEAIQTRALIEADEENWRQSGLSFYESGNSPEAKPQQGKSASQRLQDSSESQA